MNANDTYEREATAFFIATGFIAPGKSAPMTDAASIEEREVAWRVWVAASHRSAADWQAGYEAGYADGVAGHQPGVQTEIG